MSEAAIAQTPGHAITLTTDDGHELTAYEARPEGAIKGRVIVVQEIYGLNHYIRNVCERFAAEGFHTVAPALYDRVERGAEPAYDEDGTNKGVALRAALDWDKSLLDVKACADHLGAPVGIVGYCFGGIIAWLAACRLDVACASSLYGVGIGELMNEKPKCPVQFHFGRTDEYIPMDEVEKVRTSHPEIDTFIYETGHGFACDERPDEFDAEAEAVSRKRTLELFAANLS